MRCTCRDGALISSPLTRLRSRTFPAACLPDVFFVISAASAQSLSLDPSERRGGFTSRCAGVWRNSMARPRCLVRRPPSSSSAMASGFRPSAQPRAPTWRADWASCTRRSASSRWTSRGDGPRESCRELFGSVAVKIDTRTRVLRLRARARHVIDVAPPEELALLSAYVEGVNAGLSALAVKPPEYLALRIEPRPWALEDSVLVLAAMFLTLQDSEARRESRLAAVYERFRRRSPTSSPARRANGRRRSLAGHMASRASPVRACSMCAPRRLRRTALPVAVGCG